MVLLVSHGESGKCRGRISALGFRVLGVQGFGVQGLGVQGLGVRGLGVERLGGLEFRVEGCIFRTG